MVEQFLKYLSLEKRFSLHTVSAYRKDLDQLTSFLQTDFEVDDVTDVTHPHLRNWIVSLTEDELSPKSVNRKMAAVKSFFKYLQARAFIDFNPAERLKPLKVEKDLPSFIKEEEIATLLDNVEFGSDFQGCRDKLILELFYATGIRLAELSGLKENDVNFYEKTIKVLGKRNKERIIPIQDSLVSLITTYLNTKKEMGTICENLIVTDAGNQSYPMFIQRKVKKYLGVVTTLSKRSPHMLRHSFATHLLNRGADLNAIKDLLGHTSLAATQVYTHNSIEKLKATFDQAHPKA